MDGSDGMIRLNSTNYSMWKRMMEDLLYCKDLYKPVTLGDQRPDDISSEDWTIMHRKTVGFIRRWVEASVFENVCDETKAHILWKKLESIFEKKTARNKTALIRRLVNLKYRDGNSMVEHTTQFQSIANKLVALELKLDDEVQASLLLSSLPDSWETLVVTISNSAPDGKLTMDLVKDSLLNEEARRKEVGESSSGALLMQKDERQGRSQSRNWRNHNKKDHSRGRSKSRSRKNVTCYHCNKPGHMIKECRILKREQKNKKNETEANTISNDGDVEIVFDNAYVNLAFQDTDWVIDSGASYHVTSHAEFFTTYTGGDFGIVRMGNTGSSKVVGIGDIHLETNIGNKLVLKDVRHVPDIRLNLISTGKLDDEGYYNYYGGGTWKLTKGSLVVAKGKKMNTLYLTQATLCKADINAIQKDVSAELWHARLGHISEKGLQTLARKKYLPQLQSMSSLKTCDHCIVGKTHRVAFNTHSSSKRSGLIDLIHTDVCSMQSKSLGGSLYFVTFIDDHSRKVWVFNLKSKDQVLEVFTKFHPYVERETGRKLKCVRSDNGGEYRGPFEKYCQMHGIRLEKTVVKTPQQNGVAERMNRTIEERVRCMLSHSKLPKSFWGEAVRTAVDLINLSPSVPLNGDVPEKIWTGKDISYNKLRVFGCKAYVHIPKDERSKLDDKAKLCIFLGYGHEEFGYRLWDPVGKKIVRSRDVVFLEDQFGEVEKIDKPRPSISSYIDLTPVPPPTVHNNQMEDNDRMENGQEDHQDNGGRFEFDQTNEDDEHAGNEEQETHRTETEVPLRRSTRARQPSTRYTPTEYVMITDGGEPETYHEAISHEEKDEWIKAMEEEMRSLHQKSHL